MEPKQKNVVYRGFQPKDMASLAHIIVDTWQFCQYFKTAAAAQHYGCLYLADCLLHATFTQVAEVDGKAAGIIIGADYRKKRTSIRYLLSRTFHFLCLIPSIMSLPKYPPDNYNEISHEMDEICPEKGDTEITLFILHPDCRGLGVGSTLFHALTENFKATHVPRCYVHTDTVCTYRFYERHGMNLLQERKTNIAYAGQKNVTMFLYGAEY